MLKQFKSHPHWPGVEATLLELHRAQFTAWLAGGCVRDGLLGREPKDFDIATNATPEQIGEIFPGALELGKSFGVMILPFQGYQVEVATFRSDGQYKDGRHPEGVAFTSPKQDAQRRDFTSNALFFDVVEQRIHDFVGGKDDIQARVLRCVGSPMKRFREDQLRLLRGIRFSAQLDFQVEAATWQAVVDFALPLKNVSRERVIEEMEKLLGAEKASRGLEQLSKTPLLKDVFPEIFEGMAPSVQREWRWMNSFVQNGAPLEFRWALLLYGVYLQNSAAVKLWMEQQPFSKKARSSLLNVLEISQLFFQQNGQGLEDLVILWDQKRISAWLLDFLQTLTKLHGQQWTEKLAHLHKLYCANLCEDGSLVKPLLGGRDLNALGVKKGPQMGALLEKMYRIQIRDQISTREALLEHPEIKACTSTQV